jgi:hypothetical protein
MFYRRSGGQSGELEVFGGYTTKVNGKELSACSTYTCKHCNTVVFVAAKEDPANIGGLCKSCMGLICPNCVAQGNCDPYEEKLKRQEARYHMLRDIGLA